MQTPLNLALYVVLDVMAPLFATFNLSAQFLFIGTFLVSLYCQRNGIVQCFIFLGFLSLLENFRLPTLIPVCTSLIVQERYATRLNLFLFQLLLFLYFLNLFFLIHPCNPKEIYSPKLVPLCTVNILIMKNE